MSEFIDFKVFQNIPTYKLHDKALLFKNLIRKKVEPLKSASSNSSETSRAHDTVESDEFYLNSNDSIVEKPQARLNIISKQNNIKVDCFVNYRKFLGKAVKVIRRREFEPINYALLPNIKIESPLAQKNQKNTSIKAIYLVKKFLTKNHKKASSLPIISLAKLKLEELNQKISSQKINSLKNTSTQIRYMSNSVNEKKSTSCFNTSNTQNMNSKNFYVINNEVRNVNNYISNGSTQFLPARKRYKRIVT